MRRFVQVLVAATLTAGTVITFAGAGQAQTGSGDLATFCALRIEANSAETKAENVAVIEKMVAAAPTPVSAGITQLLALVKKQGNKAFESKEGAPVLAQLEAWIYDNCPGKQQTVTAIDYEYQGMPATLPAGVTKFKLTNTAPKEDHMLGIFKVNPGNEGMEIDKILALPDKKAAKVIDFDNATFMQAEAGGGVGYAPIELKPGKYIYACFFGKGGKDNGTPHYKLGMEGSFTVS